MSATCASCGAQLEGASPFCPVCGAPAPAMGTRDANLEVSALLTAANLSRVRKNWAEALERCNEALQIAPDQVDVHVLLGDIHNDMRQYADAERWYAIALEMSPGDRAVQSKLARAQTMVKGDRAQDRVKAVMAEAAGSAGQGKLDHFIRGEGFGTLVRILTFFLMGLALVVIVAAIVGRANDRRTTVTPLYPSKTSNGLTSRNATGAPSQTGGTSTQAQGGTTTAPQQGTAQPGGAPAASALPGTTPQEAAFLTRLQNHPVVTESRLNVQSAFADPRTNSITVTFQAAADSTRKSLLWQAKELAQAVVSSEPQVKMVTVRANAPLANSAGGTSVQTAFVGDITPGSAISSADPNATVETLQRLFTQTFWHPFLRGR